MFNKVDDFVLWIESLKNHNVEFSLERIRILDGIYGNPSYGLKAIHVAGTNGKGSICKACKNILLQKGLNVGLYSSPYVLKFNERISYNDRYISDEELLEIANILYNKYEIVEEKIGMPNFFEIMTIGAFIYFQKMNVDICVIEVGMGGLLDATNIITPIVSCIASISFDHCAILGNTIREIAENKLGIIKKGIPFVAIANPEINDMFIEKGKQMDCEAVVVSKDDIEVLNANYSFTEFKYKEKKYKTSMLGKYQAENMSCVIEIINILNKYYNYDINDQDILTGMSNLYVEGRIQKVNTNPTVLVDGAHNPDGIKRLIEYINEVRTDKKVKIICAISSDKDKGNMLNSLSQVADELIVTKFNYVRSSNALELYNIASAYGNVRLCEDINGLIKQIKNSNNDNILYVFCGSLYFAGDVIKLFKNNESH